MTIADDTQETNACHKISIFVLSFSGNSQNIQKKVRGAEVDDHRKGPQISENSEGIVSGEFRQPILNLRLGRSMSNFPTLCGFVDSGN